MEESHFTGSRTISLEKIKAVTTKEGSRMERHQNKRLLAEEKPEVGEGRQ